MNWRNLAAQKCRKFQAVRDPTLSLSLIETIFWQHGRESPCIGQDAAEQYNQMASGLHGTPGCAWRCWKRAKVAELADAPDLGSGGETHGGSSPPFRTTAYRI